MSTSGEERSQEVFQKFKSLCVPLLGQSSLSPTSLPTVSKLLVDIILTLRQTQETGFKLKPSLISYIFFPISTILRRNTMQTIPDQILEQLFTVLALLCESWWWDFDEQTWEQLFMLCSAVIGGLGGKGKEKQRSDETKEAAARCLWSLLHERKQDEDPQSQQDRSSANLAKYQRHARRENFVPVMGQTINSLLSTAESQHRPLQKVSLTLLHVLIKNYLPDYFIPSILPGIVSSMCKVASGRAARKGWANGDVVALSLRTMQEVIVKSVSDDLCIRDGAVHATQDLDDLVHLTDDKSSLSAPTPPRSKYAVSRSPSWLNGTASQLHIALNSLHPLVSHPRASALIALAEFAAVILRETLLTLPQSQVLLLSFLLSLSTSDFDAVSTTAHDHLLHLLQPSTTSSAALLPVLLQISRDNLTALPRLLPLHSDAKVEHAAKIVSAVCDLAKPNYPEYGINIISKGVGVLLGANGGIERWGWGLLSAMEISSPSISQTDGSTGLLILESGEPSSNLPTFPQLTLRHVSSHSTQAALDNMFKSLGRAAGDHAIFAIEWFLSVAYNSRGSQSVAALWCASYLLEGISSVSLTSENTHAGLPKQSKRLEKFARGLVRSIADEWDKEPDIEVTAGPGDDTHSGLTDVAQVEHVRGLIPIRETSRHEPSLPSMNIHPSSSQPLLHKALSLRLLALSAGILQARFTPLLLHALYPILHSLISQSPHLSTTALATLQYISNATSYATPVNMLLSNFDYALDAVSRRLTRRWLDIDATKVLALLIRLVGRDVVQQTGDVVEECFDRLDEYHGYEVIVDGLVAVLAEVVTVIAMDSEGDEVPEPEGDSRESVVSQDDKMQEFLTWFSKRHESMDTTEGDADVGPVPQQAWGQNENAEPQNAAGDKETNPLDEPPVTPTQALTTQIVARAMYFLTHNSPLIRARILSLLASAATVLPSSSLLPSVHHAWPFILNRLSDPEPFVVSAAVSLVESLSVHYGDFMYRRIWDDIWPKFKTMLAKLDESDAKNALARGGHGAVGTESAYTHSHRTYKALLTTMRSAAKHVQIQDSSVWEVIVSFRRFLHSEAHGELQSLARDLYSELAKNNEDAVWFALSATQQQLGPWKFLQEDRWNISENTCKILA
ncbi:unnamed protein product [Somion occarium]